MTEPRLTSRPETGWWTVRLGRGTPRVPAAIMWIEPIAAEPGEPLNDMQDTRSGFLAAFIAGEPVGIEEVWHRKGQPISEAEYQFLVAEAAWVRQHAPDEPVANPTKRVDLSQMRIPF